MSSENSDQDNKYLEKHHWQLGSEAATQHTYFAAILTVLDFCLFAACIPTDKIAAGLAGASMITLAQSMLVGAYMCLAAQKSMSVSGEAKVGMRWYGIAVSGSNVLSIAFALAAVFRIIASA